MVRGIIKGSKNKIIAKKERRQFGTKDWKKIERKKSE